VQFVPLKHIHDTAAWNQVKNLSKYWVAIQVLLQHQQEQLQSAAPIDIVSVKNSLLAAKKLNATLVPDQLIQHMYAMRNAELNPVCAIVGGIAAQEVIKVLSRDADPICNYFVYDSAETFVGFIETVL